MRVAALLAVPAVAVVLAWPGGSDEHHVAPLRVSSGNGVATGFAVAPNRVVTVAHVVDGQVKVRGRRARVLRIDRGSDLALLSVPGVGAAAPDTFGAGNGEYLGLVRLRDGRPSLLPVRVRRAIVAHVRAPGARHALRRPALELSGRVAPGDSGAPLVTDDGAVAGIVFAASRNRPNRAYAVDASALDRLLHPH